MKKICIFVLVLLTFTCVACFSPYYKSEKNELAICGSFAVPGMYCYEVKGMDYDCKVIEKDSYGRILYEYKANNAITGQKEFVYVICQGYDTHYVYFYEDQCYQFEKEEDSGYENLKAKNDWEKELDKDKTSRRESKVDMGWFIQYDIEIDEWEVWKLCAKELKIPTKQIKNVEFMDVDTNGNGMYLTSTKDNNKYIFMVTREYEAFYMIVEDKDVAAAIAELKAESGWRYGW